jgi:hypothetical protein
MTSDQKKNIFLVMVTRIKKKCGMSRQKKGCGPGCSKPEFDEKQYEAARPKKKRGVYHEQSLPQAETSGKHVPQLDFEGRDVLLYHPKSDTMQLTKFPRGAPTPGHLQVLWDEDVHPKTELKRILERRKEIKHRGFGLAKPPHLVKGSKEAKAHMAKLRSMRKTSK